jgi:very-short-patch-repair endonuclease
MDFKDKQILCSIRRARLLKRPTKSELIFKERLESANIKFMFQKGFIQGDNFCIADFYLPKPLRIIIEIDGNYHGTKEQQKRDLNKDAYYRQRKFTVIRIKNSEVDTFDLSILKK